MTALPLASRPTPLAAARRLLARLLDWEEWLTLLMALGLVLTVTITVEASGVTRQMPALALVGLIGLVAGAVLARSPLPLPLAWPLALVLGAAVTFWQALEATSAPGLREGTEEIATRFQLWFRVASGGGVSNDPLPFTVLLVGATWLGVFLLAWGLFRWHSAWPGIVIGGGALFLNLAVVGGDADQPLFFFGLCALLLLMRAHLIGRLREWRRAAVPRPPLISLTFLHLTAWAVLALLAFAWAMPAQVPAAGTWQTVAQRFEGVALHFVRLSGPLRVKKIIPVHDYTAVLPFRGSIDLRERQLLSVEIHDPDLRGPFLLRGAVYTRYSGGGWQSGRRVEAELPRHLQGLVRDRLQEGTLQGRLLSLTVEVEAKSVVGSVLFLPGEPLSADLPVRISLPREQVRPKLAHLPRRGTELSDFQVLAEGVPPNYIGLEVQRNAEGEVLSVLAAQVGRIPLPSVEVAQPAQPLTPGESYRVVAFLPDYTPEELRRAPRFYPFSLRERDRGWEGERYLQLPDDLPERVVRLARQVASAGVNSYDRAKAIEEYLRRIPVDYDVGETPPGRDTVDYFLFEARRGYFDYHASAMVVMLRAVGIPARLAVGFVLEEDDRDPDTGLYRLRDRNAYAWPEVLFPGYGWVPFNPTPDRPADLRPRTESEVEPAATPPDPSQVPGLPVGIGPLIIGPEPEEGGATPPPPSGGGPPVALWAGLAALGVLLGAVASASLGWRRSVAGLPYPQQVWEKTVRLASWAGLGPRPGQTPSEFARSLGRTLRSAGDLSPLAAAYNRSRFGRREPDGQEQRHLQRLWARLRGPLAWEVIRRCLLRRR